MAIDNDIAAGLIHWINSLQLTDPVFTTDELATGVTIWQLLQLADPLSFPGNLPENNLQLDDASPQAWVSRWTNLKHIYDALSIFLIEGCGQHLPIFANSNGQKINPDLRSFAQHGSLSDAVIILKLCVVVATNGENAKMFLEGMQGLPESVQRVLMETLQESHEHAIEAENDEQDREDSFSNEAETDDREEASGDSRSGPIPAPDTTAPTSELAFEERLAKVIADNQRIAHEKRELESLVVDLRSQNDSFLEKYNRSQEALTEANDRLSAVLSGRGKSNDKTPAIQNESIIADLESRLTEYETDIEGLRKSNEMLKIKTERMQKLQDDYDEIKIERDSLSRKANTAEKYRQKLEAAQDTEREVGALRQKITELQAQVRQSDTRTVSSSDQAREIEEYKRLLPAIEQECHELNAMKKRLEFDYQLLQARHTENEEQLHRSKQDVEELRGRLRDYEDGMEPPTRDANEVQAHPSNTNIQSMIETDDEQFAAAEARLTDSLLKPGEERERKPDALDDGVSEIELKAIMSAMRAQMHAGTELERESGMKIQKKMVIMLEKARSRNLDLVKQVTKQQELMANLEKAAKTPPVPPPQVTTNDDDMEQRIFDQNNMIDNLRREIRLISSAWYEQNQRLATLGSGSGGGAVALMRLKGGHGLEEPKSFLGRQRLLVDRALVGTKVTR